MADDDDGAEIDTLRAWFRPRLDQLAAKVIHQLQRIPATGIFEEYNFDSVWGEISHDIQNGPWGDISDACGDLVQMAIQAAANDLPAHEWPLVKRLAMLSGHDLEGEDFEFLCEALREKVSARAAARNLERYARDYRWWENI